MTAKTTKSQLGPHHTTCRIYIWIKEYLNKNEITFLEKYSQGWLNEYKNAWHLLKN